MNSHGVNSSASAIEITPSDTEEFRPVRAIYVGGAGNLYVEFVDSPGTSVGFINVLAGNIYPFAIRKVLATGTTATNLRGLV